MYDGSRVTDAVDYWRRRDELKPAVRVLRSRIPERFRWRKAVANVSSAVGPLRGKERSLLEEPVREIVYDLEDHALQREVVIDARRLGVDLDRGEILLRRTLADVRGFAKQTGTDLSRVARHIRLPGDPGAPIDTAAVVVVGRALADYYRTKAQRILLSVPDPDGPEKLRLHHRILVERADLDRAESQKWLGFARLTLG
jgi:hypothetical protein